MKEKKSYYFFLMLSLICLLVTCLCACSDGANGNDGTNGIDGKSAYEIWLDIGHTGTEVDFLEWLKGTNGTDGNNGTNGLSAYQIFMQQYPYYIGTEAQWLIALVNGQLRLQSVTFKSEVADDIIKYVVGGYALKDIPDVPEKEGQTSAVWDVTDFSNITQDMEVTAVYDMRKYITFHNEYVDDEDIVKVVNYGEPLTDIPEITTKIGNSSKWSISDFSRITGDMNVEAIYETQNLSFKLINQRKQYSVSKGDMDEATQELFIPSEYNDKPVTKIDDFAYTDVRIVRVPDGIVEISVGAFGGCRNLTDLFIDMTTIPKIVFGGLTNLTKLTIGKNVKEFTRCDFIMGEVGSYIPGDWPNELLRKKLQYISVADDNEVFHSINNACIIETASKKLLRSTINNNTIPADGSVTTIGEYAFEGCEFTSIIVPNTVTNIEQYAFSDCNNLNCVELSSNITNIGEYVFYRCDGLTSITIPKGVKSISSYAFTECKNLATINIPDGLLLIEDRAFYDCSNVENIILSNTVTKIWVDTFHGLDSLTSIIIPSSVTELGTYGRPFKLRTIYYEGGELEFAKISFLTYTNMSNYYDMDATKISYEQWLDMFLETTDICFYSETEPTDDGFYWHYDTDGVTPIIWEKE